MCVFFGSIDFIAMPANFYFIVIFLCIDLLTLVIVPSAFFLPFPI